MAAEAPPSSINHAPAAPIGRNLSLDPTIVALLEQQAEISAKLAILLPQTYGFNTSAELSNLRHKLRVLQTFASDRRLPQIIPILSEVEEARHLEYQIECIETVCLDHGHDLHDPRVVNALDTFHAQDAPPGFGDWLRKNLAIDDPIPRAWKQRQALIAQSKEMGRGELSHQRPHPQYRSLKCPDEGCIHYIYGFLHQTELDQHCRSHTAQLKRDSALSVGDNTPLSPRFLEYLRHRRPTDTDSHGPPSPALPPPPPSSFSPGLQLPPLVQSSHKRDHHDALRSYSFGSDLPAQYQPRASMNDETDTFLPPPKRSRVGPRLESISELGLLHGTDMCLCCKYTKEKCDQNNPCSSCKRSATTLEPTINFWPALGCHRGPLADLASCLIPDFLGPGRAQSPLASPHAQCQNMNDLLERRYWFRPELVRVVQTNLDFEDGWWTQDLACPPPADPSLPLLTEPKESPPSVLRVLASSQNMDGNAYNFWQLLKLSGLLSASRGTEALSFPMLYHAKLLLRELLFFDLQQAQPTVVTAPAYPNRDIVPSAYENGARHRIVRSCAAQFLQSFERVIQRGQSIDPRTWLATFFSLCIFSIIRTILVDMVAQKLPTDKGASPAPMHALYKATADIFTGWLPPFFDGFEVAMRDEDRELYTTASMIVKRSIWLERGISSTKDFLMHLGGKEMGGVWHGFVRQRSFFATDLPLFGVALHGGEQQSLPEMNAPQDPDTPTPLKAAETWTLSEGRTMATGELASHTDSGIPASHPSAREYRPTASDMETATHIRKSNKPPTPPQPTRRARPMHRTQCTLCNEYPDGFHGELELREHTRTKHAQLANLAKGYICVEPTSLDTSDLIRPDPHLSECDACTSNKRYTSFHDAIAHLRQAHFNAYKRDMANKSELPPLFVLGKWTREVRLSSTVQDDPVSSGGEESLGQIAYGPEYASDYVLTPPRLIQPCSPPLYEQRFSPTNLASDRPSSAARPQPTTLLPLQNQSRQPHFSPFPVSPPSAGAAMCKGMASVLTSPRIHISPIPTPPVQAQQHLPQSPMPSRETPELITTVPNTDHLAHMSIHRKSSGSLHPTSSVSAGNGVAKLEDTRHGHRNRCPYPECGRVFKDLPAHMLTHMEERPEKCPIETCEYHTKGFARKYDKNRHALTHYKGTMVCPFCHRIGSDYEKAFNRADVFKRHLTAVHNVEQTPPNSRKSTTASGVNRQGLPTGEGSEQDAAARCSICRSQFVSAQDFYEHLDDCVLNVIVPAAPKGAGEVDDGESSIAATVPGAIKPSRAQKSVATKTAGLGGSSSKSSPVADTPSSMGTDRGDQLQALSGRPPQESRRASPRNFLRNSLPSMASEGITEDDRRRWRNGFDGIYGFHQGQQRHGPDSEESDTRLVRPELGVLKQGFTMPP